MLNIIITSHRASFTNSTWYFEPAISVKLKVSRNRTIETITIPVIDLSIDQRIEIVKKHIDDLQIVAQSQYGETAKIRAFPEYLKHLTTADDLKSFYENEPSADEMWSRVQTMILEKNLKFAVNAWNGVLHMRATDGVYKNMVVAHQPHVALDILNRAA